MPRKYKQHQQLDHIIERPDTYVGSTKRQRMEKQYIGEVREGKPYLHYKELIRAVPALIRIFIEILSNALDNIPRSKEDGVKMSKIKVDFNEDHISIYNDGSWIPITEHEESKMPIPQLIFGELLTSSNYDDSEVRGGSGRNGYGAKLTNVFSNEFEIEITIPAEEGVCIYRQRWRNNMKECDEPRVTKRKQGVPGTKITWLADFAKFGCETYSKSIMGLYYRYIFDSAMVAGCDGVSVYLNGRKLPISGLKDYAKMFTESKEIMEFKSDDSVVVLTPAREFQTLAFTNGVFNSDGGVHVEDWSEAIFRPLLAKFNKKGKPQVTIRDLKSFFRLFIKCDVANPEFTSQSKTFLTHPRPIVKVTGKQINAIAKWAFAEEIRDLIKGKELLTLKKAEKKRKSFQKIAGYDPANNAGTKKSKDCILIFTEGQSAKTYAVRGIEKGFHGKKGRDWFGLFPLRGKLLNVRNAKPIAIAKNVEISNAISALNLKFGVDYTDEKNFEKLNYGKIAILCDADVDGIHIQGLLINFIHTLFPTLLQRENPFVISMETPIAKVFTRGGSRLFYNERQFKNFMLIPQNKKLKRKYYKGLGTSSNKEVQETFGERMIEYLLDEEADEKMQMLFDSKSAQQRKEWLSNYDPRQELDVSETMNISDFVDHRMIEFSIDDCGRSLPSLMDGLKESQRKILFATFKKGLKFTGKSLKVAQLAGYVAEHTDYHHGEQCLYTTIVGLANDIVGVNNLPFFFRDGQYGTRLCGGKDAAAGRYIFTKLDKLTRYLFPEADDDLLPRRKSEGEKIEPKFYVPIIPTILLNGCSAGIGTGWSCSVPLYNPRDLVAQCIKWIDGEPLTELDPWFRNFKGTVRKISPTKYETKGIIERKGDKVLVREAPIGMWTEKFKEFVEDLLERKEIKALKNYSTPQVVKFEITETPNGIRCNLNNLKLKSSVCTSNMVLFHPNGSIKRFKDTSEIIRLFCQVRMNLYKKRRKHLLDKYGEMLSISEQKYQFLLAVMNDELKLDRRKRIDIEEDMKNMGFLLKNESYDYLLRLSVLSFTDEKLHELEKETRKIIEMIDEISNKTEGEIWKEELDAFLREYDVWERANNY